jgi:hypothetical protein
MEKYDYPGRMLQRLQGSICHCFGQNRDVVRVLWPDMKLSSAESTGCGHFMLS